MKAPEKKQSLAETCHNTRILIVEDNIANQQVVCAILEHAGYSADVVSDGSAAIKVLESTAYDLVLMDCSMPIMDGFEASRLIRAPGSRVLDPDIPIIAVTALAMKGDEAKCLEAGMNYYLSKPVDHAKLISTVERFLAAASSRKSSAANRGTIAASDNWIETDPELLDSIIELFLEDAPIQIAHIESAVQNRDCDELLAVCHKIRGSSGVLGTNGITRLALAVEKAGKHQDFEQAAELALKLVAELKRFLADLTGPGV